MLKVFLRTYILKKIKLRLYPCQDGISNKWEKSKGLVQYLKDYIFTLQVPVYHVDLGSCPRSFASDAASCLFPRKTVENGPKFWDLAPRWETKDSPGSCLQSSAASAIMATCMVNQQMEDFSICPLPCKSDVLLQQI